MLNVRKEQIKNEYISLIDSGIKKKGLLTSLAKKYNIPVGTIRGWKSKDQWDNDLKNGAKSKNTRHKAVDTKYNWDQLKAKFITGDYVSVRDFVRKENIKESGNTFKHTKGWASEKKLKEQELSNSLIERTIQKTTEKLSDKISDVALNLAQDICDLIENRKLTALKLTGKILEKADMAIENVVEKETIVDEKKLLNIIRIVDLAHKVDRTVLGMDVQTMQTKPTSAEKVRDRPRKLIDLKRNEFEEDT